MLENNIRILCSVIKTDLVFVTDEGELTAFFDSTKDSPLMHSPLLRLTLTNGLREEGSPCLFEGESGLYFAAIRAEGGALLLGPMCHTRLRSMQMKQVLRGYGVQTEDIRTLPVFTLPEIRNILLLTNSALHNSNLKNEELIRLNRVIRRDEDLHRDQERFLQKEEAENEDEAYRHSYHEEQLLMQAIREGHPEEAVRLAESMDRDSGRLSESYLRHRRNLAIIGIALCARAAIDGGISPESAYRLSGYYIAKCDAAQDAAHLLHFRNRAIEELTGRVAERLNHPRGSAYVESAQDYIRKHYREKIYLADVADMLGISEGYLSRLFAKETGCRFQDYINEEKVRRAANLLLYSDSTLSEISEYVGFPNQSYFGKIFRQYKQMTPRSFRERYKNTEAFG